jgi:cytochrome c-type biogenesis protein CcmH/NrfG
MRANILWILLLAVWGLTQLVYGAVAPWAVAASALALAVLTVAAFVLLPGEMFLSKATLGFLAGAGLIFALQLLPLGMLFPVTSQLRQAHGISGFWPGTADLFLTVRCLAQFSVYVLTALLVLKLRREGVPSSVMIQGVGGVLAVQAVYGLIQQTAGLHDIPFFGPRPTPDSASGTFVNRNTFGGVMAMAVVTSAALAYSRFLAGKRRVGLFWAVVSAVFVGALILSKSRGGAVGAAVGILLLPLLHRGRASLAGALAILVAGSVATVLADPTILLDRFGELNPQEIREDTRWKVWSSTVQGALHQPVFGFGVGTHPQAYRPYQPPLLVGDVHHAHNEYVNFFFEGGATWLLLTVAGFCLWIARTWNATQRLQGPDRILPAAAIAAACAEAAHSLVDFDLRATSAGMLFAVMIGIGGAVQRSRSVPARYVAGTCAAVGGIASLILLTMGLDSEPRVDEAAQSDAPRAEKICYEALALSPFNYRAAWIYARAADESGDPLTAERRYGTAGDLWPAHPGLQHDVGLWFWGRYEETGEKRFLERAAVCFHRLFEQSPREVEDVLRELWRKEVDLADLKALIPRSAAAAGAFAGFLAGKGKWRDALAVFAEGCPEDPAYARVFDTFADRLEAEGQWGTAAAIRERRVGVRSDSAAHAACARAWQRLEAYDRALDQALLAHRMDPSNAEWVLLLGDLHRENYDTRKALENYMEAVRLAPLELKPLHRRATVYAEMKLYSSAVDDYRRALRLRPGDRDSLLGLVRSLIGNNERSEARRLIDEFLRSHPSDAEALQIHNGLTR